jgi:energy-coupling factor transporter ATP-binding protein EcfA2/energy-coupling factor transporter transmembrane protein EcfT
VTAAAPERTLPYAGPALLPDTTHVRGARRGTPLGTVEVVEAAALVDLVVAICLVGRFLPFGWLVTIPAVVPAAVVALRWRIRAVFAGLFAGAIVAFVLGGAGFTVTVTACTGIGAFIGTAFRREWGLPRSFATAIATLWLPTAIGMDALFAAFARLRVLVLAEIVNSWEGARHFVETTGMPIPLNAADRFVHWGVTHWWALLPIALLCNGMVTVVAAHIITRPILRRVRIAAPPAALHQGAAAGPPGAGPLPVRLESVSFRYPGASEDALREVSATVNPGEFVAVVGSNGSGKSTLARILAGWRPTGGQVHRPGCAAPGRPGGTCLIFQRPETQVLGVRVRDDVVWGLRGDESVDVEALLARVGLDDLADRETSTLSGGELQRLAVAAALARRPSLLVSDESTAMVDADGREQLTDLLATLPRDEGVSVVHVTHRAVEAARAHRALTLEHGRQVHAAATRTPPECRQPAVPLPASPPPASTTPASTTPAHPPLPRAPLGATEPSARLGATGTIDARPDGPPLLRLDGVGHVYSPCSPWSRRALSDVSFTLAAGEAVVVRGHNGSGKTTLASIVAGLVPPSEGSATLGGRPVTAASGEVGFAVQHARLQLLAATVGVDVMAAGGVDAAGADAALAEVGLDPDIYRDRKVEALSGGQMRRVALAGLIARRPRLAILDEPFAGLDESSRVGLLEVLVRLREQTGMTLVVVSHDLDGLGALASRMLVMDAGRLVYDGPFTEVPPDPPAPSHAGEEKPERRPRATGRRPLLGRLRRTPIAHPGTRPPGDPRPATRASRREPRRTRRRARTEPNLLRYIPGASPVHRLWAGTKLLVIGALSVVLALRPTWPVIGVCVVSIGATMALARIPRGAAPRMPRWFWFGMLAGALLTIGSKAQPIAHVGGMALSIGGVLDWLRLTAVSVIVFAAAALLGWTTPMSDLAPALARLTAPLRRLRIPIDEWIGTLALSIRCLPLLVDEIQTLMSVRRLRAPEPYDGPRALAWRRHVRTTQELLTTALVVCLRRAQEMADAVTARGGFGAIAHRPQSPRRADLLTLLAVVAAAAGALVAA